MRADSRGYRASPGLVTRGMGWSVGGGAATHSRAVGQVIGAVCAARLPSHAHALSAFVIASVYSVMLLLLLYLDHFLT